MSDAQSFAHCVNHFFSLCDFLPLAGESRQVKSSQEPANWTEQLRVPSKRLQSQSERDRLPGRQTNKPASRRTKALTSGTGANL